MYEIDRAYASDSGRLDVSCCGTIYMFFLVGLLLFLDVGATLHFASLPKCERAIMWCVSKVNDLIG